MDFKNAINKIMPEVISGSNEPLIIYRKNDGEWYSDFTQNQHGETFGWVKDAKEQDPLFIECKGSDFAKGSYPYVFDKVLCNRVWNEYNNISSSDNNSGELKALASFFDDNIGEFNQYVADYLTTFENPLAALYDMCPISLVSKYDDQSYDEEMAHYVVTYIENEVNDRLQKYDDEFMQNRYSFNDYKEISSIKINNRLMFIGENPKAEYRYMVAEYKLENILNPLDSEFTGYTDDYLEALEKFNSLVEYNINVVKSDREVKKSLYGVEPLVLTSDDCITNELNKNLKGELLIIKPETLAPECRRADFQLKFCIEDERPLKNTVLCQDLFYGHESNIKRYDILGIANTEKMPQWEYKQDERYSYTLPLKKTDNKNKNPSLLGKLDDNKQKVERNKTKIKNKINPEKKKPGIAELE